MNKFKHCISIFPVLFLIVIGCKKSLDITPTDSIQSKDAIKTMLDLEQAVTGVYASMGNTNVQYRTAGNADIVISSLMSDENYLPNENLSANGVNMYKWNIHPDEQNTWANWGSSLSPTGIYTGSNYAVIDRANRIFKALDTIPAITTTEVARKKRLKGELFALRAFCHFQVLKSYSESYEPDAMGIPYMETIADDPRSVKPSRLKVSEVFTKIHKDLDSAKINIPAFVQATNPAARTYPDITRLTKKAVSAIQARVFLYEKRWNDAIIAATEVINETPLTPRTEFSRIWSDDPLLDTATKTTEVIWKLKKETGNDRIGVFYRPSSSAVDYSPSLKLIYAFNRSADIRFSSYIRIDNNRGYNKTPNLVAKYHYNSAYLADIKLFRVSEMYLIRAEAYAESNNLTSANADINKLRSARISSNTDWNITSKEVFIDSLYRERFRELAFEGHRYFDLRRRSKSILREPRAPDDAGGTNAVELKPTQREYYLPIPGFEIRVNPNMKQNPNY